MPKRAQLTWTANSRDGTRSAARTACAAQYDFDALARDRLNRICGSKGIRTPDPLHAMQVRYRAAPWTLGVLPTVKGGNLSRLHQIAQPAPPQWAHASWTDHRLNYSPRRS